MDANTWENWGCPITTFWNLIAKDSVILSHIKWLHSKNIHYVIGTDVEVNFYTWKTDGISNKLSYDKNNIHKKIAQYMYYETVLFKLMIPNRKEAMLFKLSRL
jgi:hypothetical protein